MLVLEYFLFHHKQLSLLIFLLINFIYSVFKSIYVHINIYTLSMLKVSITLPQPPTSPVLLVAQSCPTLCDPMYYSPPGSSVHGNLQARILEWVAIFFSRGSSQPRD